MRIRHARVHSIIPRAIVLLAMVCFFAGSIPVSAQVWAGAGAADVHVRRTALETGFRSEVVPVPGGSEIVTIFARRPADDHVAGPVSDLPLISVLRDTLGDDRLENDRLRYVWLHSYTEPTFRQKLAGLVPFLYTRTRNKGVVGSEPPPPIIDLSSGDKKVWNDALWMVLKKLALSEIGVGVRASTLQYRQNAGDYRRTAIASALAVLSIYQESTGESVLTDGEMQDIQARLSLTDKTFGWRLQPENLGRVYSKETAKIRDYRGHNWELLRQYTEAQGLYFDPIEMPDGSARHAVVWVAASDLQANRGKKFDRRFLNIKSPWDDNSLLNWKGYAQVRWYDSDDREVESDTPGAHPRTLIPLALYGLDHPKVPAILIDFRDNGNPKFREISKRVLNDLTGNVLSLSQFSGLPFFVGRFVYDFVTGRRGLDINQISRMRSYAQLKLLLALDASLDDDFKDTLTRRVESATLNPLQNDADIEERIAQKQYDNLIEWAKRPDGLPKKIDSDRREEMARLKHSSTVRAFQTLGHVLSFGLYTHRETSTPDLVAAMDLRRQLDFHERFLRQVAFASAEPRIDSDIEQLRRSLAFVARSGDDAGEKTTRALAKVFAIANDAGLQELALSGLYRINNSAAKKELLAIYKSDKVPDRWRDVCAEYLRLALQEGQRISKQDARAISSIAAN